MVVKLLYKLRINKLIRKVQRLIFLIKLRQLEHDSGQKIKFIAQGDYKLDIIGDLSKFKIDKTSHLKSNTYIECSGGVNIGRYFHTGRGLTIFSTNHNYKNPTKLPYDEVSIEKPVIIKDFVWIGANVTIAPGVTIGEGAVIGMGAVVTKEIPEYSVCGGNPAKVIMYRDKEKLRKLKENGHFF